MTKKEAVVAVITLVVVLLGIKWVYMDRAPKAIGDPNVAPPLTESSFNKLPEGFLLYLVLGTNPEVISGTSKAVPDSTVLQLDATISVDESPNKIYEMYKKNLEKNGWTLLPVEADPSSPALFAKQGPNRVSVSLAPREKGSMVSISQFVRTYEGTLDQ